MLYAVMFYDIDKVAVSTSAYVVEGDGYYNAMKCLEAALGYKPWEDHYMIEQVDGLIFSANEDAPE